MCMSNYLKKKFNPIQTGLFGLSMNRRGGFRWIGLKIVWLSSSKLFETPLELHQNGKESKEKKAEKVDGEVIPYVKTSLEQLTDEKLRTDVDELMR